MRIYQSDLSGGFGAPSQSQMNLRHSVNRDAVASTFGRLVGMLRIEGGDSGELDAASLQESSYSPRLAVITHFERDCALGVMEAIGVHAPKAGAIGKSMEVLVMEKGSVVRPHIEMCEGGPCTVTYLAVFGNLRILSWGCDTKTQIWGMSDSEINFLSTSPSTLDFNQSNPHFRPLLYQALTNQAAAIRDGCFHLLVASTDAGTFSGIPCNICLSDFASVHALYLFLSGVSPLLSLFSHPQIQVVESGRCSARARCL